MPKTKRAELKEYPEHEKLRAVKDKAQAIGTFIEWLSSEGLVLARWHQHDEICHNCDRDDLVPDRASIEQLLARYFEIDLLKLDDEKRDMIEELRKGAEG